MIEFHLPDGFGAIEGLEDLVLLVAEFHEHVHEEGAVDAVVLDDEEGQWVFEGEVSVEFGFFGRGGDAGGRGSGEDAVTAGGRRRMQWGRGFGPGWELRVGRFRATPLVGVAAEGASAVERDRSAGGGLSVTWA